MPACPSLACIISSSVTELFHTNRWARLPVKKRCSGAGGAGLGRCVEAGGRPMGRRQLERWFRAGCPAAAQQTPSTVVCLCRSAPAGCPAQCTWHSQLAPPPHNRQLTSASCPAQWHSQLAPPSHTGTAHLGIQVGAAAQREVAVGRVQRGTAGGRLVEPLRICGRWQGVGGWLGGRGGDVMRLPTAWSNRAPVYETVAFVPPSPPPPPLPPVLSRHTDQLGYDDAGGCGSHTTQPHLGTAVLPPPRPPACRRCRGGSPCRRPAACSGPAGARRRPRQTEGEARGGCTSGCAAQKRSADARRRARAQQVPRAILGKLKQSGAGGYDGRRGRVEDREDGGGGLNCQ